jgi:polyhydroxybutyrate depolymerase
MRQIFKISILAAFMLLLNIAAYAAYRFEDTEGHQYQESIQELKDQGAVEGYDDGTFRPNQPINRAEFTKIILEAMDVNIRYYKDCFIDVETQWFAKYICTAKSYGIVEGYPDGTFKPENTVNMAEALSIVVKSFNIDYKQANGEEWFQPFVRFAENNNIFDSQDYDPADFILRGEMAHLIDKTAKLDSTDIVVDRTPGTDACGSNPPSKPPETFTVNGQERQAIVEVPDSYVKDKAYPLIFAFHGRTNSNSQVQNYYGIDRATRNQAIVVYPAGIESESGGSYSWSDPGDTGSNLRDYEFFDVMLEELTANYCINEDKIYAIGHSLGAWFSNSLACARGDKLRAVATLGGSRSNSSCTGATAVMQWHNPNDRLAPFSGAETTRDWFVEQNQCSQETIEVSPRDGNCIEYQGCTFGNPVVFCPHEQDYDSFDNYYPHNWPRGTGGEMWEFFQSLD